MFDDLKPILRGIISLLSLVGNMETTPAFLLMIVTATIQLFLTGIKLRSATSAIIVTSQFMQDH